MARTCRPAIVSTLTRDLIFLGTVTSSRSDWPFVQRLSPTPLLAARICSRCSIAARSTRLLLGLARAVGLGAARHRDLVLTAWSELLLANLLAVYFELDTDLTSSMFLVSTVSFLVFVLPVFTFGIAR